MFADEKHKNFGIVKHVFDITLNPRTEADIEKSSIHV